MTVRYRYKDTTMLRATQAGRLNVAPQDDDGGTPFPDHRGFRQELAYDGGEEFAVREKLPADFSGIKGDEGVDADTVAAEVEVLLAEQNPHFELVTEDGDGDPEPDQEDED